MASSTDSVVLRTSQIPIVLPNGNYRINGIIRADVNPSTMVGKGGSIAKEIISKAKQDAPMAFVLYTFNRDTSGKFLRTFYVESSSRSVAEKAFRLVEEKAGQVTETTPTAETTTATPAPAEHTEVMNISTYADIHRNHAKWASGAVAVETRTRITVAETAITIIGSTPESVADARRDLGKIIDGDIVYQIYIDNVYSKNTAFVECDSTRSAFVDVRSLVGEMRRKVQIRFDRAGHGFNIRGLTPKVVSEAKDRLISIIKGLKSVGGTDAPATSTESPETRPVVGLASGAAGGGGARPVATLLPGVVAIPGIPSVSASSDEEAPAEDTWTDVTEPTRAPEMSSIEATSTPDVIASNPFGALAPSEDEPASFPALASTTSEATTKKRRGSADLKKASRRADW